MLTTELTDDLRVGPWFQVGPSESENLRWPRPVVAGAWQARNWAAGQPAMTEMRSAPPLHRGILDAVRSEQAVPGRMIIVSAT